MKKKPIRDIDVSGKKVLVRVDFNVPIDKGKVADDSRIRAALPTIEYLREKGSRVILCSHLGRPKGKPDDKFRMDPVAKRLSGLLGSEVEKIDDCVGPQAENAANRLAPGKVLLLENTRFHQGEKDNDPAFASQLAKLADLYVNDAFGAAHRAHASTSGVARYLPAVAGLLMEKEIDTLDRLLENPDHPFAAIFGGAKISDKIGVIDRLLGSLDLLLIGGGMANTFFKSEGIQVGRSVVEEGNLETAKRIIARAMNKAVLPVDVIVAESFDAEAKHQAVHAEEIPPEMYVMDIGPGTIHLLKEKLRGVKTVVWNGPLGVTEMKPFAAGTEAMARFLADFKAIRVIGGGDTAAVISRLGLEKKMTHVSTGGGAFLEYVEGKELPGIAALQSQ
jgi:phosphoglycerate kinase